MPRKINTKKSIRRPTVFKLQKTKNMEEILKVARLGKKKSLPMVEQEQEIRSAEFSSVEPCSKSGITYLVLKGGENHQFIILYSVKISFKSESKIKTFSDKQNLRELVTTVFPRK